MTNSSSELETLTPKAQLYLLKRERIERAKRKRLYQFYPDTGPLRRELYAKHMEFFAAGKSHRERLMMAANRVGKSEGAGGYELVLHATGLYPEWWPGREFPHQVRCWAVGESSKEVRDTIQRKLLGLPGQFGTGLIPGDCIVRTIGKAGVPDAVDRIEVKHRNEHNSTITLKSYDQGREAFQADEVNVIWLDEECPESIYTECLLRTMTTGGIIMLTFTPVQGLTPLVMQFLPGGRLPVQSL